MTPLPLCSDMLDQQMAPSRSRVRVRPVQRQRIKSFRKKLDRDWWKLPASPASGKEYALDNVAKGRVSNQVLIPTVFHYGLQSSFETTAIGTRGNARFRDRFKRAAKLLRTMCIVPISDFMCSFRGSVKHREARVLRPRDAARLGVL